MPKSVIDKRMACDLYKSGLTMREIGDEFGVTRQAVHLCLKRAGQIPENASELKRHKFELRVASMEIRRLQKLDTTSMRRWGMPARERDDFEQKFGHAPIHAFIEHRINAKRRGIPFLLTLPQWWAIWQESGRWLDRGQGGFVMARTGDAGPYSVENVRITTQSENMREYNLLKRLAA